MGDTESVLKRARRRADLTQRVVAESTGITREHLANLENGERTLTVPMLRKLVPVLGLTRDDVWELVTTRAEPAPPDPGVRVFAAVGLEPEQVEEIADDLEQTPPDARRLRLLSWLLPSARAAA